MVSGMDADASTPDADAPHTDILDSDSFVTSVLARERGGSVLASRNPDVPLPPASNTKLLTAALSLHHLGPSYRFETRVSRLGDSLVLSGRGNPSLSPDDLSRLADAVRDAGIGSVTNIIADTEWFGDQSRGPGWMWEDGRYGYGAESTPLALSGNTVSVTVSGTDVEVMPDTDAVEIRAQFDEAAAELRVFRDCPENTIRVEGKPPGEPQTETVSVGDPVRHCLLAFRDALEAKGVNHTGGVRVTDDAESGETVATVTSPPVSELVRKMNVPSDNFLAEQLARTVAREVRAEGSWDAWERVVGDFLDARDAGRARIRDGSGLSRYNLISARGLVRTLEWVGERPWSEAFFDSLPAPGEGTLAERFADVSGVRAKTGTLTGSRTLSGIVRREDGTDVLFSVLLGGLVGDDEERARERIDAFVSGVAD
ncbi:D-alanyl-D-alanine carboxypeptidase/D-alanyl-D-alanine-endopeptidase [Haladaptatus paucihalophilus DX253]|uniref:D-alanyl-D-alanine carboxypeptidase/D-alanyl-D-alanine-endopeptidase n=2 Tax=Haladaptatus paucihalophilus DX253 TaxID=797209 RepID=E7QPD9_HALPU|nr:D-alanyl-D-alanine carboxypeptidase/D-alanyl-D-alanine-endopeptidase [Haladaptatus paucihalophilus DX253]